MALYFNEETGEWYDDGTGGYSIPIDAAGNDIIPSTGGGTTGSGDTTSGGSGGNLLTAFKNLLSGTGQYGTAGQLLALGGIGSLINKMMGGGSSGQFAGYKGGIPEYTATRTQTPVAEQRPTMTVAGTTVPYRPGQGGVTYFNPIQYTATGKDLAPPTAAASGGYMPGGIAMLAGGGGRFLRGPGDGVSDSIPAQFAGSGQPARLADGEFVIDARTVSEIGNGSSEAGARKLYEMMDRVHAARRKAKRGEPSGAVKYLPK